MATLRAYGTPAERAQQTQFWAQYYPANERANAQLALSAWSEAQDAQYRQDQADSAAQQQGYANAVNMARYSDNAGDLARKEMEDVRRFDINTGLAEKQLAAYGDARTLNLEASRASNAARTSANEQKALEKLQSDIFSGNVKNLDEAWAYVQKTPENVEKVTNLLSTADRELLKNQVALLNAETAKVQADQLANLLKTRGQNISDAERQAAVKLHPTMLDLIPKRLGIMDPRIRWDTDKEKWTSEAAGKSAWDIEGERVAGLRAKNRAARSLAAFAPSTVTATMPPSPTVRRGVGLGDADAERTVFQPSVPPVRRSGFATAADVRAAAQGGVITREQAVQILTTEF
jgi:hypothetical protein